jgi:large subunit ribosomal protein L2
MRHRIDIVQDKLSQPTQRSLLIRLKEHAGRSHGRIAVRFRGGQPKRLYRLVNFKRYTNPSPATVVAFEYDPYRNTPIALLKHDNGSFSYMVKIEGLSVGSRLDVGSSADIVAGNSLPLRSIPLGASVSHIELKPKRGAQLVRSAGAFAQLLAKEGGYATLRLPSGEMRRVLLDCFATIGAVANSDFKNSVLGKAGKTRLRGRRPHVRGSVMNPVDHPHGGGEGRAPVGRPSPVTPWGKPTLGYKTRKKSNPSNKYIVHRR